MLSATLEQALLGIVKKLQAEEWLAANRVAIEAYNDDVEKDGVFSDGLRSF